MSTTKGQRIMIWVITSVLAIGTIGSFFIIIVSNNNDANDAQEQQAQYEKMLAEYEEQQKQAGIENAANSLPLKGYGARKFDADSVKTLKVEVLKKGDGEVVQSSDTIKASYFGWLDDGTIFDSTQKKDADNEPATFSLEGVVEGWTKGLEGQSVGSVVRLTIPAAQAYGGQASGIIPANSPLEFVVVIHSVEDSDSQSS